MLQLAPSTMHFWYYYGLANQSQAALQLKQTI